MIPKVIHYCWFGGKEKPDDVIQYMKSWKKYCPDYKIVEWNESNFDLSINAYVKEAYEAGKWAFVTDYVRLYALYNFGGVYMDTDVELIKSIDGFLKHNAFSGFENNNQIPTGIMASEKNGKWVERLLKDYDNRHFLMSDGSYDTTTNVITISNTTVNEYGILMNNTFQDINGIVTLYQNDYFCPKDYFTEKINITPNTHCIHHFNGSWQSDMQKKTKKHQTTIINLFGKRLGSKVLQLESIMKSPRGKLWFAVKHFFKKQVIKLLGK